MLRFIQGEFVDPFRDSSMKTDMISQFPGVNTTNFQILTFQVGDTFFYWRKDMIVIASPPSSFSNGCNYKAENHGGIHGKLFSWGLLCLMS